jgi:hypothetical protein
MEKGGNMEKEGFDLKEIVETAIKVLTSPQTFFKGMPKEGGYVKPLIFMIVMGVVGGLIQSIFNIIGLRVATGLAMGVASIILVPIVIAIFGFVGAAILYLIWKLMGSQEEYETAYRCAAYISALTPITCVLGIVPYIGGAVGVALAMYFIIIASIEVHRIPSQKVWLVFGIIGAILILLTITGEISSRRMVREAGKFQKQMEKTTKEMQKQVEGATKEMQKATEEATKEMQKATEEATKALEELQKQQEKSKEKGD